MLIYIDAGHGLYTAGKRCLKSIDPNETREWTLNSRIADRVQEILSGYDCTTARADDTTGQTDISLQNRVKSSNAAKADCYISIHHNAGINGGSGGGIVVFRANGSSKTSAKLQEAVYRHTVERTGLKGNRSEPMPLNDYYVITYTNAPAVLGEFGFMDSTTDTPQILTDEHAEQLAQGIVDALVEVFGIEKLDTEPEGVSYAYTNGVHIVSVPSDKFRVSMVDTTKDELENCANAGFFASYTEQGDPFTLPVAHLVCDYDASSKWTKKYCEERGEFDGDKFRFDSSKWSYQNPFCGKAVSTMIVKNGSSQVVETVTLPEADYAISGVPVMRNGEDVSWAKDVLAQGWDASNVRATWHTFLGLNGDGRVYVMGWESSTTNLVSSSEAFKVFSALGMTDVIKLDGGGSFLFDYNGSVEKTAENRRINTIISFEDGDKTVDMDYNKWKEYMTRYRAELAAQSATLVDHVEQAVNMGITDGSRPCDFATREEVMTMVKNAKV